MQDEIVRIDQLSDAVKEVLDDMNLEVIKKVNEAAKEAADYGAKELKETSPVRTDGFDRRYPPGSYAKSWKVKVDENAVGIVNYEVHNSKHYQLTHLLEFGHVIAKTGRRSKTFPHIAKVNQEASRRFADAVEEMRL